MSVYKIKAEEKPDRAIGKKPMEIHAASEMKLVKYDLQSLLMVGMW